MYNIRVDVPSKIKNGSEVVFHTPCDCSAISGLSVYYLNDNNVEESKSFEFKDAHGYSLGDLDNLFTEGVYVKVILNVDEGVAYIQNADTNKYLEERFEEVTRDLELEVSERQDITDHIMSSFILNGEKKTLTVGVDIHVGQTINFLYLSTEGYKISSSRQNPIGFSTKYANGVDDFYATYHKDSITIEDFDTYTFTGVYADIINESVKGQIANVSWDDIGTVPTTDPSTLVSDDVIYGAYHKVSDTIVTYSSLYLNGGTISYYKVKDGVIDSELTTVEFPNEDKYISVHRHSSGNYIAFDGFILAIFTDTGNPVFGAVTLKMEDGGAGVYFCQNSHFLVHSVSINNYDGFIEIDKIPEKYLPNRVAKISDINRLEYEIEDREREISVERKRIDSLLALEEGSTTGDAELQDIRVAYDGAIYDSAGEAVREQTSALFESVRALENKKAFGDVKFDKNTGYLHFYGDDGSDVIEPVHIPGSGTGGSGSTGGSSALMSAANTTGWLSTTISDSEDCWVSFNWSSVEDGLQTGNGTLKLVVNGNTKLTRTIEQGEATLNLREYLSVGTNVVRITITDIYGSSRTLAMEVMVESLSLTSTFNDAIVYTGNITFPYTPTGSATKTMQFILDDSLIGSVDVKTSGRQQNFTIPVQSHGSHTFEVYFTAEINGNIVGSDHLYYDIIFEEKGNNTPIIASSFNIKKMVQYYNISIPWLVYTPNSLTSEVTLYVNGEVFKTLPAVDRTKQVWTYRADTDGELLLEIVTGTGENEIRKPFNITVSKASIEVSAEENDLDLYLTSHGRSNAEDNPATWKYGDVSAEFSNFNWVSDGWQLDDNQNTVLRLLGDARVFIPLNVFSSDFRTTGKTIEFEFTTKDVMDYETVIISCFANNKGFVFTPQKATLSSEQSSVFTQYKENEPVRISFVVDKKVENRLINVYIDGILSGTVQYPESDDFQQGEPVGISIGSNDCILDLYCIRIYSNNLTRYQMLDNWIADTPNGYEMVQRYNHNDIYDDYGQVVISKLPSDLPYFVIECVKLPQYKGDKKTCSGYYVDPINTDKSFRFEGAQIDVQGTSSQYYARKNYKIKFKSGFTLDVTGSTIEKYQMRDDAIPVDTFTFKADVASCEGANNVELVRLYNDICPYKTPPQLENPDVRQGIDGFPIVMFWSNGKETSFLGKYNFNNDKGTPEVFGLNDNDESWEIRNNTSARSMFKSADFSGTAWLEDFEGRHPDGNTDPTELKKLAEWLVSTDQAQATGNAIASRTFDGVTYTTDTAEYRLAKFKAEAKDWFEMDSIIFSYIFTELFLLVDSRAKNNFPTFYDNGKWCVLPYDMDTAIGTNNEGLLIFPYNLEDTDTFNGANVYNGQDSVIYINTRDAFPDKIEEMYKKLRSDDLLSYDIIEKRFEDHQALWSEAIFNEDAYFKYIQPLIESGEASYLSMCQGSKESQRKWWLFNRFRYIDSKYTCGDALTQTITLRAYQKSDFEITPYADIYPCVAFDSTRVKERGRRGEVCDIISPEHWDPNGSDAVVTVYSADQLKDIGDLAPFKVGYADFSKAIKIQKIKIGDASADYTNPNMTEFYAGNNKLLRHVDFRNCINLGGNIDLSGCANIEEAYFNNTVITGVNFPNGGILRKVHLPETIANLTIMNQEKLDELVIPSYSNIATLRLENIGTVDTFNILNGMPAGGRVRLIGVNWSIDDAEKLINLLSTMRGLDENGNNVSTPQIAGTCHVEVLHVSRLRILNTLYPSLIITYNELDTTAYTRTYLQRTLSGTYTNNRITSVGLRGFADMKELERITLPNVTQLGDYAFYMCYNLVYIDLPSVQKFTANGPFSAVGNHASVPVRLLLRNQNAVVTAYAGVANDIDIIYVPRALVDSYKADTVWSTYASKIFALEDYTVDGTVTGILDESKTPA